MLATFNIRPEVIEFISIYTLNCNRRSKEIKHPHTWTIIEKYFKGLQGEGHSGVKVKIIKVS
jgi:hypothetical protein